MTYADGAGELTAKLLKLGSRGAYVMSMDEYTRVKNRKYRQVKKYNVSLRLYNMRRIDEQNIVGTQRAEKV